MPIPATPAGRLSFDFPNTHPDAFFAIELQRTIRVPDNGRVHYLPPGLGSYPIAEIDGRQAVPMHPIEALWIRFVTANYPCAVLVAAGSVNALTGLPFAPTLTALPQNYCATPGQPWLDGFKTEDGSVRQFVAVPLGLGLAVEEQVSTAPAKGGIGVTVVPMKAERYETMQEVKRQREREQLRARVLGGSAAEDFADSGPLFSLSGDMSGLGLGAGGRIRQQIDRDRHDPDAYDLAAAQTVELSMVDPLIWQLRTGFQPPRLPPRFVEYVRSEGLWFDHKSASPAIPAAAGLAGVKSVKDAAGPGAIAAIVATDEEDESALEFAGLMN